MAEPKPFIQKLYSMVQDDDSAVGWTPDGTSFQIVHVEPFVQKTLRSEFKNCTVLTGWGVI